MKFSTVYHNYYCYCKNATRMIVVVAFLQFSSGKLLVMSEVVANSQLTQIVRNMAPSRSLFVILVIE